MLQIEIVVTNWSKSAHSFWIQRITCMFQTVSGTHIIQAVAQTVTSVEPTEGFLKGFRYTVHAAAPNLWDNLLCEIRRAISPYWT